MRSHVSRAIFVCLEILPLVAGCQDYRWQWSFQSPEQIQTLEQRSFDQHKLVFIFYKSFFDNDRMHADVLADNKVGALFQDTVNIIIDKSAGPAYERYLAKYGVQSPPAFVLAVSEERYKVLTGCIPKDEFIEMIQAAKAELLDHSRPPSASKPAP